LYSYSTKPGARQLNCPAHQLNRLLIAPTTDKTDVKGRGRACIFTMQKMQSEIRRSPSGSTGAQFQRESPALSLADTRSGSVAGMQQDANIQYQCRRFGEQTRERGTLLPARLGYSSAEGCMGPGLQGLDRSRSSRSLLKRAPNFDGTANHGGWIW